MRPRRARGRLGGESAGTIAARSAYRWSSSTSPTPLAAIGSLLVESVRPAVLVPFDERSGGVGVFSPQIYGLEPARCWCGADFGVRARPLDADRDGVSHGRRARPCLRPSIAHASGGRRELTYAVRAPAEAFRALARRQGRRDRISAADLAVGIPRSSASMASC